MPHQVTSASTITIVLTLTGRRKCTESTLAVTQGPRATTFDANPAHMSTQPSTVPPRHTPCLSQSSGRHSCCITTRVEAIGSSNAAAPP